ncbi:hypothetical protein B0H13DRAFT_2545678 [Mycena leptocephala]|nr:hypothetical protein B0H13DRAFT_2545678 [Mycena leptocephala]
MAITRFSSARSSSPTPSENSDMYYEDLNNATPTPAPSQTADALGWETDDTPAPTDPHDVTPTAQTARATTPASVVEISAEDFPGLPAPAPATVTKPHATKAAKAKKGKEKAKTTEAGESVSLRSILDLTHHAAVADPVGHTSDSDDPFLAADIARATAASLGQQVEHDSATAGASSSSSHRPDATSGSPSKRQRANTAGDASATTSAPAVNPETTGATIALTVAQAAAPVIVPDAAPCVISLLFYNLVLTRCCRAALTFAQAAAPVVVPDVAPAAPAQPAIGGDVPPMWLTADGLPPRGSYTPTPAGGFACIVYEPLQLLQDIPPELILLYEGVPFPKIFLVVSGGNGAVMRTHGCIRDAIGNFINVDPTSFTLSTPPTAAHGTSSALWLLADLPGLLTQAVLDNRVLSSTAITLYPLPYDIPIAGFVGVFAGFTLPHSDAGANAACDLIRAALQNNSEIREFVHTHHSAYGPVAANEAWEILLASIVVQGIDLLVQDTRTVAWRLHVDPPTTDRTEWGQFRRLFGKLQVLTLHGTARLQRPFRCHICPSVDHPTPLCLFPYTPGWLGPTHATIAAVLDTSRAAAAKAQEMMRPANLDVGASNFRGSNGRGRGGPGPKARHGGGGKKGGDPKGKGRQRDEFF